MCDIIHMFFTSAFYLMIQIRWLIYTHHAFEGNIDQLFQLNSAPKLANQMNICHTTALFHPSNVPHHLGTCPSTNKIHLTNPIPVSFERLWPKLCGHDRFHPPFPLPDSERRFDEHPQRCPFKSTSADRQSPEWNQGVLWSTSWWQTCFYYRHMWRLYCACSTLLSSFDSSLLFATLLCATLLCSTHFTLLSSIPPMLSSLYVGSCSMKCSLNIFFDSKFPWGNVFQRWQYL